MMNSEDCGNQDRRRYYIEDVALFVEQLLALQSEAGRARWAHLPGLIRAHRFPFFYVTPTTRIVDLVQPAPEREV